ncbi:hypothetical protein [Nonomuraea typhae]|uniref:hypothetical protein n=1 Tax=Nonomuraea typhae TaxID=2603600 RepID=UPI0012F86A8F|nr:hypothetical protein [Nonomuraea typhae]
MSASQVHSYLIFLDSPEAFPLDFHATVSGRTPEEIRQLALDKARDFYGPTLEDTGVHVLSTHVMAVPDSETHRGAYQATIVFRQVTD